MIEATSKNIIKGAIERYSGHFGIPKHQTHLKVWIGFTNETDGKQEEEINLDELPLIYSLVHNYTETIWDGIPFSGACKETGMPANLSISGKKLDMMNFGYLSQLGIRAMLKRLSKKHDLELRDSFGILLMPKGTDVVLVAVVNEIKGVVATYRLEDVLQMQVA